MMNNMSLNNKYQFESFIERDDNDSTRAVAVVENLGLSNPLYIYMENRGFR